MDIERMSQPPAWPAPGQGDDLFMLESPRHNGSIDVSPVLSGNDAFVFNGLDASGDR